MKVDMNKENTELAVTLSTPDYMSKETAEKLKPFLRRPIVYQWKNGAFTIFHSPLSINQALIDECHHLRCMFFYALK